MDAPNTIINHSTSLFLANIFVTCSDTSSLQETDNVLLSMQSIKSLEGTLGCQFDNAATCFLLTACAARCLNLSGEPNRVTITNVSGSKTIDSVIYYVPHVKGNNYIHTVKVLQVGNISDSVPKIDLSCM